MNRGLILCAALAILTGCVSGGTHSPTRETGRETGGTGVSVSGEVLLGVVSSKSTP